MMFYNFEVGQEVYKLRLTTRGIIEFEKNNGINPLGIFSTDGGIPTLSAMLSVFHASLQAYNHNITLDKAYDIFDKWIEEGHTLTDFVNVLLEVYKVSGLIADEQKN